MYAVDPEADGAASPKSEEEAALIGGAIRSNFLFQHLTLAQKNTVIQLMQKVHTYIHSFITTYIHTYIHSFITIRTVHTAHTPSMLGVLNIHTSIFKAN